MKTSKDIDSYIASYPQKTQVLLEEMRAVICKAAPQATEAISYGVPTYKLNGNLVHFGGFKSHIGFFPTPSGIKHFQKELSAYKTSKGAVQFPIEKPIPVGLGACPSNRCSNPSESDSSLDYEQALSPLEYRSDAASAAECAGLRAEGPRLAVIVELVRESLDLKAIMCSYVSGLGQP